MADSKISALPAATLPLAGTEVLPIVQSGTTKKSTVNAILNIAGSVLQVVSTSSFTNYSTTSATFQATNLGATITPKYNTSKILVIVAGGNIDTSVANGQAETTIYRGSTNLGTADGLANYFGASRIIVPIAMSFLDSPATTAATSYTAYFRSLTGNSVSFNNGNGPASITLLEIAA